MLQGVLLKGTCNLMEAEGESTPNTHCPLRAHGQRDSSPLVEGIAIYASSTLAILIRPTIHLAESIIPFAMTPSISMLIGFCARARKCRLIFRRWQHPWHQLAVSAPKLCHGSIATGEQKSLQRLQF